jgi:hypothetical protein
MQGRVASLISLLILQLIISLQVSAQSVRSNGYGPEVRSFLDWMRHEEEELEFQIRHNEISRREYIRSKTQLAIHRQTVLDLVKESGRDKVPELHVVAGSELEQLIEDGASIIKNIERGDIIKDKWRYIGSVHRGEIFYIF